MRPATLDYLDKMRILANMKPDWNDSEIVNRWSKGAFKPKYLAEFKKIPRSEDRNLQTEIYDTLAGVSSLIPPSLEEKVYEKINEICKKENTNMPTKNHEYFMKLLEENGLKAVTCSVDWTSYEPVSIHIDGILPTVELNNNKKEYNTMYNNRKPKNNSHCTYVEPTSIIRRDDTTRVDWEDGTKTVIVLEEGKQDLDMFHTFCIAFTKKVMGSTTAILNAIKNSDTDAIEKTRKEAIEKANREAEEEAKKMKEKADKEAFEAMVREEMLCYKVREEAIRRLMVKERKEEIKMVKDLCNRLTDNSEEESNQSVEE